MSSSGPPDVSFIHIVNGAFFIAIILETFMNGLYTVLFAQAIRRLAKKKDKVVHMVILTSLWISVMLGFLMDCILIYTGYVRHNTSPLDMARYFIDNSPSTEVYVIVNRVFNTMAMAIADGILVWRCYILWDGNKWMAGGLGALFSATAVTGFVTSVPTHTWPRPVLNGLSSFSYLCSATTTFLATFLIILKIHLITRKSGSNYSYKGIFHLLINSAFLYTICIIISGVFGLYTDYNPLHTDASGARVYSAAITFVIVANPMAGIAPTLIALFADKVVLVVDTEASRPMSHLTFRRTRGEEVSCMTASAVSGIQDDEVQEKERSTNAGCEGTSVHDDMRTQGGTQSA